MEKYRAEIFSFSRILNLFDAFVKFKWLESKDSFTSTSAKRTVFIYF